MDKKQLIKSAYIDFRDGQWDQAVEKYQQLLNLDPMDVNVLNMLADAQVRRGQVTEALQYYKAALQIFQKQGQTGKVEILRRKLAKLYPEIGEEPQAEAAPAPAAQESEKPEVEKLKKIIAADPKNFENYQKLGDLLVRQGRNTEAAEQYLVIGSALYNNRIYKKAGLVFQRILQLDPGNLQAHIAMGEIYAKDNADSDAKKEFLFVTEQLVRQGNLERAQTYAQKAIEHKSIEAHYSLGLIYYQKHKPEEARQEFETLLKFKVNHQGALTHLARLEGERGQHEDALKLYERLIKIDVKNADALEKMAETAAKLQQTQVALEKFNQAMEVFAADEEWERAAVCANQAVKLDPRNHQLYLKLADASYNAGLEQQAAEACLALAGILEAEGKTAEAGQMRAKAAELTGEAVPAATPQAPPPPLPRTQPSPPPAAIPAAAIAAPDETQVMMNMADSYVQQGSLDEAIEIYQKILKNDPNNEKIKNALTRIYATFAGVNPETAVARKGAVAASKAEKEEQRVQREAREKAQQEARVRAERNAGVDPSPAPAKPVSPPKTSMHEIGSARGDEIAGENQDEFMTVTVAEIYTKQGLLNEALKIYQKILEIEPDNKEAQRKKKELEEKIQEGETMRRQSEKAAASIRERKPEAAAPAPPEETKKPKLWDDEQNPPSGRRGRVSYV